MQRAIRSGSGQNLVSVSEQQILGTATGDVDASTRKGYAAPVTLVPRERLRKKLPAGGRTSQFDGHAHVENVGGYKTQMPARRVKDAARYGLEDGSACTRLPRPQAASQ